MNLEPLMQWVCDTCAEVILRPEDGALEWLVDDANGAYGYRICHVSSKNRVCYKYNAKFMPLSEMTGSAGVARMLAKLDIGPIHDPRREFPPRVKDFHSWTEAFRRLHVKHYEEARLYFDAAQQDGLFSDGHEFWPYLEETLLKVIRKFGRIVEAT